MGWASVLGGSPGSWPRLVSSRGFVFDLLGLCIPRAPHWWLRSPRACAVWAGESLLRTDVRRGRNYFSFWLDFGSVQLEED